MDSWKGLFTNDKVDTATAAFPVQNKSRNMNPTEYLNPKWKEGGHVHNWRNHVGPRIREAWLTFTLEQRRILALTAADEADKEEWD